MQVSLFFKFNRVTKIFFIRISEYQKNFTACKKKYSQYCYVNENLWVGAYFADFTKFHIFSLSNITFYIFNKIF